MNGGNGQKKKCSKQPDLPNNFEENLRVLETKYSNGDASVGTVKNLLELYILAMEYYISIDDIEQFTEYQMKNNRIIQNVNVLTSNESSDSCIYQDNQNLIASNHNSADKSHIQSDRLIKEHVSYINKKLRQN